VCTLSNEDSVLTWDISGLGGYEFTNYPQDGINPLSGTFLGLNWPTAKLETYSIQTLSGLKSIHGDALMNPTGSDGGYQAQTVNPNVTWTVVNTALSDFDNSTYWKNWFTGHYYIPPGGEYHTAHVYLVTSCSYADGDGA